MNARLTVIPFLFVAACSYPQFESSRSVAFTLPANAIRELACESHNGGITVTGNPDATEITAHVDITVRGHTQAEADDNLDLLDVGREETGNRLRLFGKVDPQLANNMSPSFSWRLEVPQRMDLDLSTHNGHVTVRDAEGKLAAETHNGHVEASLSTNDVRVETHNGHVDLVVAGEGPLRGKVETHNGGVEVTVGGDRDTTIEADTHNGRVQVAHEGASFSKRRTEARVKLGDGTGRLAVSTHNGGIHIR